MALLGCSVSHHYWFHAFWIEFLNETSTTPCPNGAKEDLCRPFLNLYSKSILWSCNALEATFFRYSHQCRLHSNPHCLPEGADDRVLLPLKRQCAQVCDLHRSWSPSPGRRRPRRGHTLHSVHWGHPLFRMYFRWPFHIFALIWASFSENCFLSAALTSHTHLRITTLAFYIVYISSWSRPAAIGDFTLPAFFALSAAVCRSWNRRAAVLPSPEGLQ